MDEVSEVSMIRDWEEDLGGKSESMTAALIGVTVETFRKFKNFERRLEAAKAECPDPRLLLNYLEDIE